MKKNRIILKVNKEEAIKILNNDEVLVHPTDTVYGISCKYTSSIGYRKIFTLKKRSLKKPLGILLSSLAEIKHFSDISLEELSKIVDLLNLGVTVIVPLKKNLPSHISAQSDHIGIRIPNNRKIQEFLAESGPLLSTSANLSTKNPITTYEECIKFFSHSTAYYDIDIHMNSVNSTIIQHIKGKYKLIREGNIPSKTISSKVPLLF